VSHLGDVAIIDSYGNDVDIVGYFTYAVVSEFAGDSKAASAWKRAHSVAQNAMLIARVRS